MWRTKKNKVNARKKNQPSASMMTQLFDDKGLMGIQYQGNGSYTNQKSESTCLPISICLYFLYELALYQREHTMLVFQGQAYFTEC